MNLNYLCICLLGISVCFLAATVEAIVAGRKAEVNGFPYQVSIQLRSRGHLCGGGIIDDRFVITAAYCICNSTHNMRIQDLSVVAGTNSVYRTDRPAVKTAVQTVFFPKVFRQHVSHNIALLELTDSLRLAHPRNHVNLRKLHLPREPPQPNEVAIVAGYGWQTVHELPDNRMNGSTDGELHYASVQVIRDESCLQIFGSGRVRTDVNFCAHMRPPPFYGSSNVYGTCIRDNGGPLVRDGGIIGILSRIAEHCNERQFPAVYVRVTYFSRMISNVLENGYDPNMLALRAPSSPLGRIFGH